MRVTVLCEYGTLQGGERSLLAMMDHLADGSGQFTVVAPGTGRLADELRERGVSHVPLDLRDGSGRRFPRDTAEAALREAVRATRPDLLHANSLSMGRISGAISRELGIPATAHLRDILRVSGRTVSDLNRNYRLLAVSQATLDYHVGQGVDPGRIEVAYNGVDLLEFQPRPPTGRLKRDLGITESAFLAATIGQICLRKGHDVLAAGARRLAGAGHEVHFLVAGERYSTKPESVEFEQNIAQEFAAAGLSGRLQRVGYRHDVAWILNEVDALVHPARQEPLGRVLLEAAASGTAIVATSVGGTSEILTDGESGLLVPPDDPVALAKAIARVAGDEELRRRLGQAARGTAVARFDVSQRAEGVARIWRELAG
jgi:glycosyltransferase involved in cell wall biosynthesis